MAWGQKPVRAMMATMDDDMMARRRPLTNQPMVNTRITAAIHGMVAKASRMRRRMSDSNWSRNQMVEL